VRRGIFIAYLTLILGGLGFIIALGLLHA